MVFGARNNATVAGKSGREKGKTDLAKLFSTMDGRSGGDRFKLAKAGTVRFRLVEPIGSDSIPMCPADEHWIPYVKDDGKEGKKQLYCFDLHDELCPICVLHNLLTSSKIAELEDMAKEIRVNKRWLMYVINRTYMLTQEEPTVVETMEKVEKAALPQSVAQAIVNLMRNKAWGDPTSPTTGYDVEVTGKPKGGKSEYTEYTVSPVPRDASPNYNPALTAQFKPLSDLIEFKTEDEIQNIIEPILATLSANGYEKIVDDFWATIEGSSDTGSSHEGEDTSTETEVAEGDEAVGGTDGEDAGAVEGSAEESGEEAGEGAEQPASEEGAEAGEAEGAVDPEPEPEPEPVAEPVKAPAAPVSSLRGGAGFASTRKGQPPAAAAPAATGGLRRPSQAAAASAAPVAAPRKSPNESTMAKGAAAKEKAGGLLSTLSNIRKGKK